MLEAIPEEILYAIIEKVLNSRDRWRVCQVSKKLYALVLPILYESIIVEAEDESDLMQTNISKFLRTPAAKKNLAFVKNVQFIAPIKSIIKFRCLHYQLQGVWDREEVDSTENESEFAIHAVDVVMPNIEPLLRCLRDNYLRSFHWHIGTCVPNNLLGFGGYLPTKQSRIEHLSMITGDPCSLRYEESEYPICLTAFKFLKKFSWSGGLSRKNFDALRDMLIVNAATLEELKIDLIDWWDAQWNWSIYDGEQIEWTRNNNFFSGKVLGLLPGEDRNLFPSLTSLSLSSVEFKHASLEMAYAFNISKLRYLNLHDCVNAGSFLREVCQSGQPINLRTLELVIRHLNRSWRGKEEDEDWYEKFLKTFEGLVDLRLLVLNDEGIPVAYRYWPCVFHHKKTLRRLVYHEKHVDHYSREYYDTTLSYDEILALFATIDLECVGLCISNPPPLYKELDLSQFTSTKALRFLYIRKTCPEPDHTPDNPIAQPYEVAQWAFNKFPNLLFIAEGDFSLRGRYSEWNELLCRDPFPGGSKTEPPDDQWLSLQTQVNLNLGMKRLRVNFRGLRADDYGLWDRLDEFRDVLEACPAEPLYEKDF